VKRSHYKSLQDHWKNRQEADARRAELVAQLKKSLPGRQALQVEVTKQPSAQAPAPEVEPATRLFSRPAYVPVRLGDPRRDGTSVVLQPWTIELTEALLGRAEDGRISLRLIWPLELSPIAILHALATLSRAFSEDLVGLRTLYYPGTQASWTVFDRLTVDRAQLKSLWQSLNERAPKRSAEAFAALLSAANHLELFRPGAPPPRLRQLVPAFVYDPVGRVFAPTTLAPLDALIAKIVKRELRKQLHGKIDPAWNDPRLAPGAFLTLPRGLKRNHWKEAIAKPRRGAAMPIDVCLFDATTRVLHADAASVRRIPSLLADVRESRGGGLGALIVTDDPTAYLVFRAEFNRMGLDVDSEVVVAEAARLDALVSPVQKPSGWVPAQRASTNFKATILDSPAAKLAQKFGAIADLIREHRPEAEELLRRAQGFIMKTSHLPGGFVDLREPSGESHDYLSASLEWSRVEAPIRAELATGRLNVARDRIETSLKQAREYVQQCDDETPLALKVKDEVARRAVSSRDGLTIVFPSRPLIAVAHRYLARKLGDAWESARAHLNWVALVDAESALTARSDGQRLLIVGLPPTALRFLMTHPEIPKATDVFVPQQRAVSVLPVLQFLSGVAVLEPYRKRLALLLAELKRHLDEVPDLDSLVKSFNRTLALPRLASAASSAEEKRAFRFVLENEGIVYAYGYVYVYDVEEGSGFRRALAKSVREGDLVFEMSDALRDRIETLLELSDVGSLVESSEERKLLAVYHDAVERRVALRFPQVTRAAQARAIRARIEELKPGASVNEDRIRYWLAVDSEDSAPHGARDRASFNLFCQALGIDEANAELYWWYVIAARASNQAYGRVLSAWYAEIIFQPETAQVYRSISAEELRYLRAEAESCVYRVVRVIPPDTTIEKRS
jgi:hypothetical protein